MAGSSIHAIFGFTLFVIIISLSVIHCFEKTILPSWATPIAEGSKNFEWGMENSWIFFRGSRCRGRETIYSLQNYVSFEF